MENNPLVSIITPSYNSGKYIEECIKSVLNQDYPHIEHIIQDGGSTDNTKKILKKYSNQKYKNRIKWVSEPDKGQTEALNKALNRSKGEILLILNADDILLSYACSWAVENMRKYPKAAVIYGDEYIVEESGEIINTFVSDNFNILKLFCVEIVPPTQAAFIRRKSFEKVGFYFDESLQSCADYEIWVRLSLQFPFQHVFGVISKFRWHQQSKTCSPKLLNNFIKEKKEVMDRYFKLNYLAWAMKNKKRANAGLNFWAATMSLNSNQKGKFLKYSLKAFLSNPSKKYIGYYLSNFRRKNNKKNHNNSHFKKQFTLSKKPLISILTPSFNSGKYIEECIQSVISQDYPQIEHIIYDGFSTDSTQEILKKYQKIRYQGRIKIFIEPDRGQSDALNKAIQKARGEILLVLNADDVLLPDACSWAVSNLRKYPRVAVVYGDQYVFNEKGEITGLHLAGEYEFEKVLCVELVPPAQAAFIRRSALEKVGFWADTDLDTCPDFEMWARLTGKFPMKHTFGAITKYRIHKNPQIDSKMPRMTERFVAAKREVMDRIFNSPKTPKHIKKLRRRAYAGLDLWASDVAFSLKQPRQGFYYLIRSFSRRPSVNTLKRIIQTFYFLLKLFFLKITLRKFFDQQILNFKRYLARQLKTSFEHISANQVKNFWDEHPCNIRHSKNKIGTKEYFDEVEKRKYMVEPHIPKFAQFARWKGKKVLEIGCGIGTDTINFARAGAKVTAIEISKKSLDIAKQRAKVYGLNRQIRFYLVDAEQLSKVVPVEPYDLIYSFGVIHHTPHPYRVIQEIRKYTRASTVIKLMIYHRFSWKVLWILLKYGKGAFWKIGELISNYSEAAFGSPVTYTYTKKQAKRLLKHFQVLRMEADHIFPYNISEYRNYQYKKVWYFRYLPKSLFRFLETHLGWHLLITAKPIWEKS